MTSDNPYDSTGAVRSDSTWVVDAKIMTGRSDDREDDSLNGLFEVLSHEYRRYILWMLADPEGRTDEPIETTLFAGDDDEPDILHLQLHHNHLPKLDDYELVDWDPETETLTRGPRFEEIEPLLDVMEDRDGIPSDWS